MITITFDEASVSGKRLTVKCPRRGHMPISGRWPDGLYDYHERNRSRPLAAPARVPRPMAISDRTRIDPTIRWTRRSATIVVIPRANHRRLRPLTHEIDTDTTEAFRPSSSEPYRSGGVGQTSMGRDRCTRHCPNGQYQPLFTRPAVVLDAGLKTDAAAGYLPSATRPSIRSSW